MDNYILQESILNEITKKLSKLEDKIVNTKHEVLDAMCGIGDTDQNEQRTTSRIVDVYLEVLELYDSEFPDIKKDAISHYNILKTNILSYLKEKLFEDVKDSIYEEELLLKYKSKK